MKFLAGNRGSSGAADDQEEDDEMCRALKDFFLPVVPLFRCPIFS